MASRREGQNLGPYRLIEQIGQGGMATVYKAYQPSMERYVAVKILPPHYADDPQFAERFIREARTIAKLEHMNILPVYDFGEEKDTAYLVMRYLEGGTLKSVMKQGRLSLPDIQQLFSQICSALDYAHRQGVIHRDVKPANIMIDTEGAAFLTDFGIAKVLKGVSQLTATGAAIGTPTYMAPEQSLAKGVDARSDTYALGVILYEMVVGKVPYEADTPMAVALAHIHEPLPLPREMDLAIPEGVEAVILKALAKEPDDRFQTARELAAALREAVREATKIKPEPAEATLVDLVAEARTAELEKATRVVDEPLAEEAAVEEPVLEEPLLEQPYTEDPGQEEAVIQEVIVEETAIEAPRTRVEEPPTVIEPAPDEQATEGDEEAPIHAAQAVKEALELPPIDQAPRKPLPTRTIAMGVGGIAFIVLVIVGVTSGLFGGRDEVAQVTDSAQPALALAEQTTPTETRQPTFTPPPTKTPRPPTPTPTPRSTAESGLTIIDDFNIADGSIDSKRWWGGDPFFKVENGKLVSRVNKGREIDESVGPSLKKTWTPRSSGPIRFSVEIKTLYPSSNRNPTIYSDSSFYIISEVGYQFTVQIGLDGSDMIPRFQCFMQNPDGYTPVSPRGSLTTFDEWHTLRLDIQEDNSADGLVVIGYGDGKQICTMKPPAEWQAAMARGQKFSIGLYSYWSKPWNLENEFEVWFDDLAVWPFSVPSGILPTTNSGLVIFDSFNAGDGAMDSDRWEGGEIPYWVIEDGVLTFEAAKGESPDGKSGAATSYLWPTRRSGSIRFSVESTILSSSGNKSTHESNLANLHLKGPEGTEYHFWIQLEYYANAVSPHISCALADPEWNPVYKIDGRWTTFDEWHTLRFDIQENSTGDGFVVVGYGDGQRVCTYTPGSEWQEAVRNGGKVAIGLSTWWWEDPGPLDTSMRFLFDDVAVWPPLEE